MELHTSNRSIVLLVLISAAFVALFVRAMDRPSEARYMMVDELVADGLDKHGGEPLKVHGWVVPGSIHREHGWAAFVLTKAGARLRVRVDAPLPDTLCDQSEVVVEGTLHAGILEGNSLHTKCASKYDGSRPRRCGESVMLFE